MGVLSRLPQFQQELERLEWLEKDCTVFPFEDAPRFARTFWESYRETLATEEEVEKNIVPATGKGALGYDEMTILVGASRAANKMFRRRAPGPPPPPSTPTNNAAASSEPVPALAPAQTLAPRASAASASAPAQPLAPRASALDALSSRA